MIRMEVWDMGPRNGIIDNCSNAADMGVVGMDLGL